jgi:Flp pilus assembly protein TadB
MAEWNISSGDPMTLEQKPERRSPTRWLRENSIRIAILAGVIEAIVAWHYDIRWLWLVGVLTVIGYFYIRRRVPARLRRPLWMLAMSQAVAGIILPAIFGLFFVFAVVGGLLLVIAVLFLLGDLRRT